MGSRRPSRNQDLHFVQVRLTIHCQERLWKQDTPHRPHLLQPVWRCYINSPLAQTNLERGKEKGKGRSTNFTVYRKETEGNWAVTELSWMLSFSSISGNGIFKAKFLSVIKKWKKLLLFTLSLWTHACKLFPPLLPSSSKSPSSLFFFFFFF